MFLVKEDIMKEYKEIVDLENTNEGDYSEKQNMIVEACTMIILAASLIVLFCLL